MSLAGSITGGLVGGSGGYEAYQRITNGGFANGSSWTINNAAWAIAAGVARTTEGAGGDDLTQSFSVVPSGVPVALSVLVVGNTFGQTLQCNLTYLGIAVQTVMASTATGTVTVNTTSTDNFDGIQFRVIEDAGVTTIDDVSLIA